MKRLGQAATALPGVGPRSYWLDEALRADPGEPCPPLAGETPADVCIVGGGFAGLWTAYELTEREPSLDIVLLEADVCGAGGSGANGGFFSCSWHGLAALCRFLGEDAGVRYAGFLADQVAELDAWVARHDADIDLHHEGIVYARAGDWQSPPDPAGLALVARHGYGERFHEVSAEEARRVADSPRFLGGAFTPDLATIQPAKLARELRRVLLARGVRIHEATGMRTLRAGHPAIVETAGGRVRADQVVLTTGAWAAGERHFSRAFAVAVDYMVVTERIPGLLEQIGWTSHTGIADSREMLYYLRRTEDDRVAIGGGSMGAAFGGRIHGRVTTSAHLVEVAARGLTWLFPQLKDVRFEAAWSGPMDVTRPSLPFFLTAPSGNLHAGLGFSGHGLTPTKVGGKTLASLVLGAEDEWSGLPLVGPPLTRVPPELVRWPMVRSMAWLMETGDHAEESGRSRGWVRTAAGRVFDTYTGVVPRSPSDAAGVPGGR